MALKFPSAEWTAAFKDAVNANAAYGSAGKDWHCKHRASDLSSLPGLSITHRQYVADVWKL